MIYTGAVCVGIDERAVSRGLEPLNADMGTFVATRECAGFRRRSKCIDPRPLFRRQRASGTMSYKFALATGLLTLVGCSSELASPAEGRYVVFKTSVISIGEGFQEDAEDCGFPTSPVADSSDFVFSLAPDGGLITDLAGCELPVSVEGSVLSAGIWDCTFAADSVAAGVGITARRYSFFHLGTTSGTFAAAFINTQLSNSGARRTCVVSEGMIMLYPGGK